MEEVYFLIPEDTYQLLAKTMGDGSTVETKDNIYVMELYDYEWRITDNLTYNNITITNQSGETITIHDAESETYQGFYLKNGESNTYALSDTIQTLLARSIAGDREVFLNEIQSSWTINQLQSSFFLGIDESDIVSGSIINVPEITLEWFVGTENQEVTFQLLNATYPPYNQPSTFSPPITSFEYQYLDESEDGENYVFTINSSVLGMEYGSQEFSFSVDAIQPNGLRIFLCKHN